MKMDDNKTILRYYKKQRRNAVNTTQVETKSQTRDDTYYMAFKVNNDGGLQHGTMSFEDAAIGKTYSVCLDNVHICKELVHVFRKHHPVEFHRLSFWTVRLQTSNTTASIIELLEPVNETIDGHYLKACIQNGNLQSFEDTCYMRTEQRMFFKDGVLQDPKAGQPAWVITDTKTPLVVEKHYTDGKLQDPESGKAAYSHFHHGLCNYEVHYLNGVRQEPT